MKLLVDYCTHKMGLPIINMYEGLNQHWKKEITWKIKRGKAIEAGKAVTQNCVG